MLYTSVCDCVEYFQERERKRDLSLQGALAGWLPTFKKYEKECMDA